MTTDELLVDVDEADVVVLDDSLRSIRQITQTMAGSLRDIQQQAARSSRNISPLVRASKKLSMHQKNIKESFDVIGVIKGYAQRAAQLETTLNDSEAIRKIGVRPFIDTLNRTNALKAEIQKAGLQDFEGIISGLRSSVTEGMLYLRLYYDDVLAKYSMPFDPEPYMKDKTHFPVVERAALEDIKLIYHYYSGTNSFADDRLVSQRSEMISKSMKHLEATTTPSSVKATYDRGSNGIGAYAEALIVFITSETQLYNAVLGQGNDKMPRLFMNVFAQPFATYNEILNKIFTFAVKHVTGYGPLLFELYHWNSKVLVAVRSSVAQTPENLKRTMDVTKEHADKFFREFLEVIDTKFAESAAVNPAGETGINFLASECVTRLTKIAEFHDLLAGVIQHMKMGDWFPSPKPVWAQTFTTVSGPTENADARYLLSSFFSDALDCIFVNLELKQKPHLKREHLGIMLLVNISVAEELMNKTRLGAVLGQPGMERLEKLRKRAKMFFRDAWSSCAQHLMDVTVINGASQGGSLSSKEKEAIKEKFKSFNHEFEERCRAFKSYRITDPKLKKYLVDEITFLIPLYNRFYDKHSSGDFTKHAGKYIKYDKAQLEQAIRALGN